MTGFRLGLLVALSLVGFTANTVLCRMALGVAQRIDAVSFTIIRVVSGALVLALLAGPKRAMSQGTMRGALLLCAYAFGFSLAYTRIQAAAGTLLLVGAVQVAMLSAAIRRGRNPSPRTWLGLSAALAGVVWLVAPGSQAPDPLGSALMVGAGIAWGAYSLAGIQATDALGATAGNFTRAVVPAAVLLLAMLGTATTLLTPTGVLLASCSGALASGVGYAAWYAAMPRLGPMRAAILQLLLPILSAVAAWPLLGEPLTMRVLGAGAVVIGGVALALSAPRR